MNWLLLRGLARDQRHWGDFPRVLENAFSGSKIEFLDLPGFGTESKRSSPTTIPKIVNDLKDRWDHRRKSSGDRSEWGIISISMGSMVALDWLAKHPDDFSRLVIMNASARNLASPLRRMQFKALKGILKAATKKDPLQRESLIAEIVLNRADPKKAAEQWAQFSKENPAALSNVGRQLLAASRYDAPLFLSKPTLILASEKDQLAHADCSRKLAKLYESPLSMHPHAGHDIPMDDPEWIISEIQNWVGNESYAASIM